MKIRQSRVGAAGVLHERLSPHVRVDRLLQVGEFVDSCRERFQHSWASGAVSRTRGTRGVSCPKLKIKSSHSVVIGRVAFTSGTICGRGIGRDGRGASSSGTRRGRAIRWGAKDLASERVPTSSKEEVATPCRILRGVCAGVATFGKFPSSRWVWVCLRR